MQTISYMPEMAAEPGLCSQGADASSSGNKGRTVTVVHASMLQM